MKKYDFDLAGSNGSARDGSDIQQTLKQLFEDELEGGASARKHEVKFEEYDNAGAKAYAVLVDGKEVGSVAGDDAADFAELSEKADKCRVIFGVNGHDIDEYEKIIDRYKDKKFWKEEDPNFDDKEVNAAYNDLMNGLKEGAVYHASLSFPGEKAAYEAESKLTPEEKKQKEDMDVFVKYFKILMPLSVLLLIIGILYLIKLSTIMGILNLFFGALGLYFSWKYTKPARTQKKKEKERERQQF